MTDTAAVLPGPERAPWPAIRRGLSCRCPACGEGRMFRAYLKVVDACPACGEELHHHRSDDAPPYFTIFIVGHIVIPIVLFLEIRYAPPLALQLAIWIPVMIGLSMAMLQPIKGAVVGYQWAARMHGFDPRQRGDELEFSASS
jgi:uncharacterized protein (DUF983 family)